MALSFLLLLILILLIAFAFQGSSRHQPRRGFLMIERLRPRPLPIRVSCAVLAAGCIGSVTWGTLRSIGDKTLAEPEFTVLAVATPDNGRGDAAADEADNGEPVEPEQLILTVLVVEPGAVRPRVAAAESRLLDWPQQRDEETVMAGQAAGGTYEVKHVIHALEARADGGFRTHGNLNISTRRGSSSSGQGGTAPDVADLTTGAMPMSTSYERSRLSAVPDATRGRLLVMVHLAAVDRQPPTEVAAADWLESHREVWELKVRLNQFDGSALHDLRTGQGPAGIRMLRYAGWPGALLFLGCALASQLVIRRGRAFVLASVAAVLWLSMLDRVVVERLADRAAADGTRVEQRERALERLRHSFFHAGLAQERIKEVRTMAADEQG